MSMVLCQCLGLAPQGEKVLQGGKHTCTADG